MGGGRGYGYGNSPSSLASLGSNIGDAKKQFPFSHGRKFGNAGAGRNVQVIKSKDPLKTAKQLFKLLSKGGKQVKTNNKNTIVVSFEDGTHITFRPNSKSKSPAIDIRPSHTAKKYIAEHKIHFEKDK